MYYFIIITCILILVGYLIYKFKNPLKVTLEPMVDNENTGVI